MEYIEQLVYKGTPSPQPSPSRERGKKIPSLLWGEGWGEGPKMTSKHKRTFIA